MTTLAILPALMGFALVTLFTPGPNNLMLMASGANFGLRRSVPHMAGVALGFAGMAGLVGLGLARVFEIWPLLTQVLRFASVAFLLWLAYKIATAAPKAADAPETEGRPLTFLQAAAFQWVNPKAWAMAVTATSAYAAHQGLWGVALVVTVFAVMGTLSAGLWTVLGQGLRRLLSAPWRLRAFNWTMAALLVATLWPILNAL
ncbi:LysE family translocator [Limimaricola pyoseonensis]|uniref:Threonine/homoserine/homoserine lactone efflux protein n=1 Tax=Limimaricola pyoseonensis TaxID=521013 RepID=A0A1G7DIS8_9RHOB|nr:LysE family translocator [Limimaricola pyoseonensis]SDE50996.1 Threonine/homoserine/homoserine lactone efflux protein [Limimaricola pyoseonensis]